MLHARDGVRRLQPTKITTQTHSSVGAMIVEMVAVRDDGTSKVARPIDVDGDRNS